MQEKNLSRYLDLIFLTLALIGGYVWLQLPQLKALSLQGFAIAMLIFFGLKFFSKHRHQTLPQMANFELVPLAFALVLLIGDTGATASSYFALLYIFLLLLVLSSGMYTAIIVTSELVLLLYALSLQLETTNIQQLISLPLMLGFFLYIKYQLDVRQQQQTQLSQSASALKSVSQQKMTLEKFVGGFLKPKLAALSQLGKNEQTTKQVLLSQLDLLENEIDKVLLRSEKTSSSEQESPIEPVAPVGSIEEAELPATHGQSPSSI